jgi:hypothetical protein
VDCYWHAVEQADFNLTSTTFYPCPDLRDHQLLHAFFEYASGEPMSARGGRGENRPVRSGGVRHLGDLPAIGQEVGQAVGGMGANAAEHVAQVGERIHA